MELVPGFTSLLHPLVSTMTGPTFDSLMTLVTGWVFTGRRTITQMILAAGSSAEKHYSSYHRVFSAARWSLDAVGLAISGQSGDAGPRRHAGSQAGAENVRLRHAP